MAESAVLRKRYMRFVERLNTRRIFISALISVAVACVFLFCGSLRSKTGGWNGGYIAVAVYLPFALAATIYGYQALTKKKRRDELWLFRMLYTLTLICFSSVFSYFFYQKMDSLTVYYMAVILIASILIFSKTEYIFCAAAELVLPVLLCVSGKLSSEAILLAVASHLIGVLIFMQVQKSVYAAFEYRSRYHDEVKLSEIDPLTGLKNRRCVNGEISLTWSVCERTSQKVAILIIDVDQFKKYNDRFGHPAGDECLKRIATVIQSVIRRKSDVAARVGGEEFMVFLTGAAYKDAMRLAEKIRDGVEQLHMEHSDNARYAYVSVSIGLVTTICSPEMGFAELYRRADKELYRAKNAGRNRVSGYEERSGSKLVTK